MIKYYCPITGVELELLAPFPNSCIRVTALHPLLNASPDQLVKLAPAREQDTKLLFHALTFKLHELGFITLSGIPELSAHWMAQELPHLQTFLQWCNLNTNNIRKELLPTFRMDSATIPQNFQEWRQECQSIIATWDTMLDASIARHIKREREAALALLTAPANLQPKIAKSPRVSRAQARLTFVRDALESHSDLSITVIEFYLKVLALPHTYEVVQLQKTKDCFLDYLPDSSIEDYNDKRTCLQLLDAAIMEKVGLAQMLGMGSQSKEEAEIVDNIRAENSTFADGRRFVTSANPNLNSAMNMLESRKPSTIPELPVYTVEPKREDFASELGFKVAHKSWVRYAATLAMVQTCENGSVE